MKIFQHSEADNCFFHFNVRDLEPGEVAVMLNDNKVELVRVIRVWQTETTDLATVARLKIENDVLMEDGYRYNLAQPNTAITCTKEKKDDYVGYEH